ncbi:MAG: conjugal transfer protein TraV [Novosphingobium sp.]
MSRAPYFSRLLAAAPFALLAGCTTLGGHVAGDFSCRAPKGDCAPSRVIDQRAIGGLTDETGPLGPPQRQSWARAEPGDLARTREHMLKVVFPAHIDRAGIFHDEAAAWALAEASDWAARARALPGDASPKALGRAINERLKAERHAATAGGDTASDAANNTAADDFAPPITDDPILPLASQLLPLPSTTREAVAGAHAPGIEGFDPPAPGTRTPRSTDQGSALLFPSIEAINAAHARAPKKMGPPAPEASETPALPAREAQ